MNLRFHPGVQRDLNEILGYYSERSKIAAERFWHELHDRFAQIAANPQRFGLLDEERGLRRARLRKFPFVIVYYEAPAGVKVTCVKHEKQHPLRGLKRR